MLADSMGIKFLGEGEWKTKKHGAERRCQWRRVHLGIDVQTLQIRAIVVTTNKVEGSPMAAERLRQIPSHEDVASFTGNGAYDTKDMHEAGRPPRHPSSPRSEAAQKAGIRSSQ